MEYQAVLHIETIQIKHKLDFKMKFYQQRREMIILALQNQNFYR